MSAFKFELGDAVKDVVTGFSGIVTGRCEYITGCKQYSVTSRKLQAGDTKAGWFDEDRIVTTKASKVKIDVKANGGPQCAPAKG